MTTRLPPVPAWSAALIATLVGFGGTIALVVQAMRHLGASTDQTASAVTALCLGIAIGGATLSLRLRIPVVLAWSTPGAALLAASAPGLAWPVAVGAFLSAAVLMVIVGAVPMFARTAERIPTGIGAAMLAGVLLPFCLGLFRIAGVDPLLVALLLAVFIIARQRLPLYAMLLALAAGMALTLLRGDIGALPPGHTLGTLTAIIPTFDARVILSLGIPLFLVTLVSQNLPGLAVLRSAGYEPPARPLVVGSALAWLAAAPFGGHGINLAAITAAICTNSEAHPDRAKRWTVGMLYAGFYLLVALIAPMAVRLFLALPPHVIAALTGLALIPALLGAIETMLADKATREPAILTFLAAGSGLTLFGLGSAFWGLAVGFVALAAGRLGKGQ